MAKLLRRDVKKKNRLSGIEINEISLVDNPAVSSAKFCLFKRDGGVDMKLEKDKNLLILEKASEGLDTTIEKFGKEEKPDALALAMEAVGLIVPVVNFCTETLVEKNKPENLAKEKEVEYSNFMKWSILNGIDNSTEIWKQYTDGTTPVKYLWFPPAPPPVIKKREEMTEEELAKDFSEVVEIVKTGKKISKKNAEIIKNAIATLTSLLQEIEGLDKKADLPKVVEEDPLEKEFKALPEEEQKEAMKILEELKVKVDSLEKKKS